MAVNGLTTMTEEPRKPRRRQGRRVLVPTPDVLKALNDALSPGANALAEEAAAEYAQAMQQEAANVSFLNVNWAAVMQRGGRGEVNFGYWRATRLLKLEDVGLVAATAKEREAMERVLQLPKGRLLVGRSDFDPISEAASVESRGRSLLKLYSIRSGLGPFIPLGEIDALHPEAGWHYREFKAAMAAIERDFLSVRDRMAEPEQWEALVSQTIAYWVSVADNLYGTMLSNGRLPRRSDIGLDKGNPNDTPSQTEWVSWFVNTRVRPYMRTREEAAASFRFSWSVQPILPPQALLEAQANAALDSAEMELRQDMIDKAGDAVDSFYRDVVADLRLKLLENCKAAVEAMAKNDGKLPARTQTGLRGLIEYIEAVKVWPDRDIEEQIAEMRAALDLPSNVREVAAEEISAMFRRIAAEAALTLEEIDRSEMRSSRSLNLDALDLPDDGPELERLAGRARRTLNIDAPTQGSDEVTIARRVRGRRLD